MATGSDPFRFVMVPVPEFLEEKVPSLVLQMVLTAGMDTWDPDDLMALVAELSEAERRLISTLLETSLENERMDLDDLAQDLDITLNELHEQIDNINRHASERGVTFLVLVLPDVTVLDGPEPITAFLTQKTATMLAQMLG